ncbi:MAG TPA: DUF882 domain-containing protein [Crinalium sp.]|jgi:hypothetical protein
MTQILEITQDTVFKRRPLQSKELSADEMVATKKGTKLELQSYAYADASGDDFDDHIKFAVKNQQDAIKGFNTWYVYELHAQVVQDGAVVYPLDETDSAQTLKVIHDTVFKRQPVDAAKLGPKETYSVKQGANFDLQSYAYADADGNEFNNHIKIALDDPKDFIYSLSTWFVYENHVQVLLDNEIVYPPDQPLTPPKTANQQGAMAQPAKPGSTPPAATGPSFILVGYSKTAYLNQPIVSGGSFTWAEATKNGTRIPKTRKIVDNMIALATALERPRNQIGRPFQITSWYRPPEVNRNTPGSAKNSQHMYGKAIDFKVAGMTPRQIQQALEWWPGGMGTYPRGNGGWNHLDIGPRRRWIG